MFYNYFFLIQEFTEYEKHTLMHVYHCEECNKPFAGIGGLRIHKRKHMPLYRRNKAKVKSLTNGRNLYI